jgi:predicted RNase H-like nuclease (RuvC/YqgF family)
MRARNLLPLLILGFVLFGCSALKTIDNSSEEEMRKFSASKDELWGDIKRLDAHNRNLETRVDEKERVISFLGKKNDELTKQTEDLKLEVQSLKQKEEAARRDNVMKMAVEEKKSSAEKRASEGKLSKLAVKIKVLAGHGRLQPATSMVARLSEMGYRVERIEYAPKAKIFPVHTVYFADGFRDTAKNIARNLGGKTIVKPLTWPSVFHVIVVTRGK